MSDDDGQGDQSLAATASDLYVDTQAERELSVREQVTRMATTYSSTDNYVVGLALNVATIALGVLVYLATDEWIALGGAVFAILGALGILSGVLRL